MSGSKISYNSKLLSSFGVRSGNWFFWAALICATFYNSYRYPLQINFSGTSPTYSDTPFSFQVGKYILILVFAASSLVCFRIRLKLGLQSIFTICMIGFSAACVVRGIISGEENFITVAFFPLAAMIISLGVRGLNFDGLMSFIRILFLVSLIVNAVQVVLFFSVGRLPALAYDGSISVRFGSFLDDPNAFGAINFLFFGWIFSGKVRYRLILIFALFVNVLITQSVTAISCFICFLLWKVLIGKKAVRIFSVVLGVILMSVAALNVNVLEPLLVELIDVKSASAVQHVSFTHVLDGLSLFNFIFGSDKEIFLESWWAYSVVNFGAIVTVMFLMAAIVLQIVLRSEFKNSRSATERAVLSSIFYFGLYFLVGGLNLPFPLIFPVNFIYFLLASAVVCRRLKIKRYVFSARSYPIN